MARASLRDKIVESGVTTLHQRGYMGAGVRDISAAACAPQGSFTNHFRSKETFAVAVLDLYHDRAKAIMDQTLRNNSLPPRARLEAYFEAISTHLEAAGWRYGCLISNLGLETSEHSELLRRRLETIFAGLPGPFADVIRDGQWAGQFRRDISADDLAGVLLFAWHGAMLRMKVDRSPAPIERFKRVFLSTLIDPSPPSAGLSDTSLEQ